jgi:hypothetical protein
MHPFAPKAAVPQGHHPATPRFLLSLLSTAIYLSIPSVASEALQRILASVGPSTVVHYLNYAIGRGIGLGGADDAHAAVGLEHIGKDLSPAHSPHASSSAHAAAASSSSSVQEHASELVELEAKLGEVHLREQDDSAGPAYFYGAVGNRVGEAAACFLARWGVDLLAAEEGALHGTTNAPAFGAPSARHGTTTTMTNNASDISANTVTSHAYTRAYQAFSGRMGVDAPRIWTRGLSARWVSGLISSDEFFVQGEWKRYEFSKRVVELRRSLKGVLREEEREWRKLFEEGIYYSNLVSRSCLRVRWVIEG